MGSRGAVKHLVRSGKRRLRALPGVFSFLHLCQVFSAPLPLSLEGGAGGMEAGVGEISKLSEGICHGH